MTSPLPPFVYGRTFSSAFTLPIRQEARQARDWSPGIMEMSRMEDDRVLLSIGFYPRVQAALDKATTRRLAAKLLAALDDWPDNS